jgi:oligoribonuclease
MKNDEARFVWVDLEMTGLDVASCGIVEMAVVITGPDLATIAEWETPIWQPEEVLGRMDPFVRAMHERSGLLDRIRASKLSVRDAEKKALALVAEHTAFGEGILAGNTIYMDRLFLRQYMPQFEGFLHYRQVDVSSLKVLVKTWHPDHEFKKPGKTHTALDDIRGSIAELAYYRQHLLHPRDVDAQSIGSTPR